MEATPSIYGLSLDSANESRATFKAGVSLASRGENNPIQLIKVVPARTQMKIMSLHQTGYLSGEISIILIDCRILKYMIMKQLKNLSILIAVMMVPLMTSCSESAKLEKTCTAL